MRKAVIIIVILLALILAAIFVYCEFINKENKKKSNEIKSNSEEKNDGGEDEMIIYIKVNGEVLSVILDNNLAAKELYEKLSSNDIIISMRDYGEFEKVGKLDFSLPTNDEYITTNIGDIVLYQGDEITIHYGSNSWSYTRLGKVKDVSENDLKKFLTTGNIELTMSLNDN